MNVRAVNREFARQAEAIAVLTDDSRALARVRRLVGAQPDHVGAAVRRVLDDRRRLVLALEDAVHRMAFDRDALGLPESREAWAARALLDKLSAWRLATGQPATGPPRGIPPETDAPGSAA